MEKKKEEGNKQKSCLYLTTDFRSGSMRNWGSAVYAPELAVQRAIHTGKQGITAAFCWEA